MICEHREHPKKLKNSPLIQILGIYIKKIVIGVSVSVLLIVTTLCGCFDDNNNSNGEPQIDQIIINQIKNNFINATYNISSYKCYTPGELTTKIYKGEKTIATERLSYANLSVNISNHNLEFETEFITVGEGDKDMLITYIIGNFKYTGTGKEGDLSWDYEEFSETTAESIWTVYSSLERFAEIMADPLLAQDINITWKRLEDESFDSRTYYVIQSAEIRNNTNPTLTGNNLIETYHTFWIDNTTYSLYKVKLNQISDARGFYAGENDRRYMSSEYIFNFYDYNIPVKIELPPGVP